ncbi:RTA1-domain-containing protein, partial [Aureobasidium melanogenum]
AAFDQGTSTSTGTTIMVVGIIAQLVSGMVFAGFLCIVFPRGALQIKASRPLLLACTAIVISTTMMNLRGFYRSIELCQGWTGPLITHQGYVIGLDAAPMLVAMGVLAVLNPSVLLRRVEMKQVVEGDMNPIDVEKGVPNRLDSDAET